MALARVVTFEGVSTEAMEGVRSRIESGERPEGLPSMEIFLLHDPESEKSMAIQFFETEDDYRTGDAALSAMPTTDTPGQRTSVTKYQVAGRMKA
ncbi:MAG TPA: hypothetical protein VD766_05215 [Solirubrobacterales bacterium]|jgi:hypothetical protein|nr:hypothetical protein [Solirubrobacterales bacterium]